MSPADADALLSLEDDFNLCDGVFCAIADVTDNRIDAANEPEPCRTVSLIWQAGGIIGNGGFQYLFEGSFNGDPGYSITAAAYDTIGAIKSHSAFQSALSLFSYGALPGNVEERLNVYQSHPKATRDRIDREFWDGDEAVKQMLSQFIRANKKRFLDFLTSTR